MSDIRQVEPVEGSYVTEWRAIQYTVGDWSSIKRLLRPLGYSVFVDLGDLDGPVLVLVHNFSQSFMREEDWVIISPHDKVRIMDSATFNDNFTEVRE